jgi:2-amino-4-hydroxy-6-hydroxymethyldihydropteridine diphosphokinase
VGVGSNIDPEENVPRALAALEREPGISLSGISTFYRTAALSDPTRTSGLDRQRAAHSDPDFFNGVLEIQTRRTPQELLDVFASIEASLGRRRGESRWAPRPMDLDLLLYGALEQGGSVLTWRSLGPDGGMVHDDIEHRAFVALPLMELAPDLILPPYGTPLRALAASFSTPGGSPETEFSSCLRARFLGT